MAKQNIQNIFPASYLLLLLLTLFITMPNLATSADTQLQADAQSLLHSLDYISVDYPGTVDKGVITDEAEYAEQQEFALQMSEVLKRMPDNDQKSSLSARITQIQRFIANRVAGEDVTALCRETSALLIEGYQVAVAPKAPPSIELGRQLFQSQCVECHGVIGLGDGPMAATLDPAPANFHDRQRQSQRNIFSLYATLTLGVNGTAMRPFSELSDNQRWALAFYASNFYASDAERLKGEQVWEEKNSDAIKDLNQLSLLTPAKAMELGGDDGVALLAYLRENPGLLAPPVKGAIKISRDKLTASLEAYRAGQSEQAYELAMSSYLDGFELTEGQLKTVAPDLRKQVEVEMTEYRQIIKSGQSIEKLEIVYRGILTQLDTVQSILSNASESASVTFVSSLLILLREGLEAILVLSAIAAFLAKAGRSHDLKYVHMGWISALLLGVVTWVVANYFFNISGANREITEGIAALVAAAMLLYVGFWLHRNANARQWKKFIHDKLDSQLNQKAIWGLVLIAFIAVYREVLETVLFYQTFWLQSSEYGHRYIIFGFVVAAVILVVVAWAMFRFSVRLPLRAFFLTNAVLLFILALVYSGKGIVALQEAGVIPKNLISFIEVDLLGIYPNVESLGLQALILIVAVIWLMRQRSVQ